MTSPLATAVAVFKRYSAIIIICISGLNIFIWFKGGAPVGFSDGGLQTMFLHPLLQLQSALYSWNTFQLGGVPSNSNIAVAPIDAIAVILRSTHLPLYFSQALIWYGIEITGMLGCRAWLIRLFRYHPRVKLISLCGALFYAFNMMTALSFWYWDKLNITTIAGTSVLLWATEIALTESKFLGAFTLSIAIFIGSSIFLDGIVLVPVVLLCGIYAMIRTIHLSNNTANAIKLASRITFSTVVALFANAWVVLPFIQSIAGYYTSASSQINAAAALANSTAWSTWSGLFRLLPFGTALSGAWLYRPAHWIYAYNTIPFWILSFIIFFIFLAGYFARQHRSIWRLLAGLLLGGLVFQAGAKGLFGSLVKWVVLDLPFGSVFRTPWRSLAPISIIGASGLFGLGIASLREWAGNHFGVAKTNVFVVVLVFLTCGIYTFPLWTGQIINPPITERIVPISPYVQIPNAYRDVASFLSSRRGWFRVLGLPLSPTSYYTTSKWPSGYDGSDERWLLFEHPTISFTASNAFPATGLLQTFELKSSKFSFSELVATAGLLSSKYIIVDGYMRTKTGAYYGQELHSPNYYNTGLDNIGLRPVMSSGELKVYKIPERYYYPPLYGQVIGSNRNEAILSSTIAQVNPVHWRINFSELRGQVLIVLGQNYNKGWRIEISSGSGSKVGKVAVQHVLANGFANGWILKPSRGIKDARISVVYQPQQFIQFGVILSLFVWAIMTVVAAEKYLFRRVAIKTTEIDSAGSA